MFILDKPLRMYTPARQIGLLQLLFFILLSVLFIAVYKCSVLHYLNCKWYYLRTLQVASNVVHHFLTSGFNLLNVFTVAFQKVQLSHLNLFTFSSV
jgi:hypothetical protein